MASHLMDCAASMKLPPSKKLTLMAFADSGDKFSRRALPGFDTVLEWSGLGRSQAMAMIAELVKDGLLVRISAATRGHRAEFIVFPRGCCEQHGPVDATPVAPAGSGAADPGAQPGSGQPDPKPNGSGKGSGNGSGSSRTPSDLPISTPSLPPTSGESPPTPPAKSDRKKPAVRLPEDWTLSPGLRKWTEDRHPKLPIDEELEKFKARAERDDARYVNWDRAWHTWCSNWAGWQRERQQQRRSGAYTDDKWHDGSAQKGWDEFMGGAGT